MSDPTVLADTFDAWFKEKYPDEYAYAIKWRSDLHLQAKNPDYLMTILKLVDEWRKTK